MLDQAVEWLGTPPGIGAAVVAGLAVLFVVRKILSLVFFIAALGLAGWGAARYFGWDIPYVLPGEMRAAVGRVMRSADAEEGLAGIEAATTLAPSAAGARSAAAGAAEAAAEDVRRSELRYNAPESMLLNMPIDLRLVVDPTGAGSPEELLEGLPGEVRSGQADLTKQVTATLVGDNFDIRPVKPERQVLAADRPSTWQWEVTPRAAGRHTLMLEVFAHPGGSEAAAPVREFTDTIEVRVSVVSRVLAFVQTTEPVMGFIAATVSLTLAGLTIVVGRRPRRRIEPR